MTEENITQNDSNIPIQFESSNQIEELNDKNNDEKNLNSKQNLTRTMIVNKKIESFSLDDLGKIEYAKKHRSANRPLHKIKEFNSNVNFCRCCNLPCEEKGIIEPFHFCDDIDMFSECGLGITLYFYFFQFMILILFLGIIVLSISMIIFNHNYTEGIIHVCNEYFNISNNINELKYCEGFVDTQEKTNLYKRFNRWIVRLSSDNIKVYRHLPEQLKGKYEKKIDDIVVNYSILNFCYLLTVFILNIFFIIFTKAQAQKARLLNFSIRDYTVLITNAKQILHDYIKEKKDKNLVLLRGSQIAIENGEEFKMFVNDYIKMKKKLMNIKINNINLCYDLGSYIEFRDEYENCKRKIFQVEHNPYNIQLNYEYGLFGEKRFYFEFYLYKYGLYWCHCCHDNGYPNSLLLLRKSKDDLKNQLDEEQKNADFVTEKKFTGNMLVSFETIKDKEIFLSQYPHNFFGRIFYFLQNFKYYICCCCINKDERFRFFRAKGIDVYSPPEPEDIIWENFKYSSRERKIRTILVFLICIPIMAFSLGCVFGLTFVQDILYENNRKEGSMNICLRYLISLGITIIISGVNTFFQLALEHFTHQEKQISRSKYILSLSIKISIFTFLNSAIIPLISKHLVLIIKEKDNKNVDNPTYERFRERDNLIIDDMLVYFIVNSIITPILWTLYFPYLIKKMKQCFIENEEKPDESHYLTQRDLNELYLYPDMNLAYKYSYLAKTTAMCLFYFPIFPLGFIFSFVGFIFGYYLEKYNFTHLYRRPEMLDEIITEVYANYYIIIIFVGAIGDYFFLDKDFNNNKWALANLILFGILIIIPYTKLFDYNYVGINKSDYKNYSLSKVYFTFYNDYQRQNPLTKRIGLLNYLSELKKCDYLSEYAYQVAKDNIDQLNIMEIYYGISRGNLPITHQSIISNVYNSSILCQGEISKSILGKGLLRSTIIMPEIKDNTEIKKQKKQFFDSQILNMFGKEIIKRGLTGNNMNNIEKDTKQNEKHNNIFSDLPLSSSNVL